jgi:mycothiol synthase
MQQGHIIRNYQPQDFSRLLHLGKSFNKYNTARAMGSFEALDRILTRPGYNAAEDLFIAEIDGNIVGYINVLPEPGIGRAILEYFFHPAYCTGQVPSGLLEHALEHAGRIKARVAHMNIPSAEITTAQMVENAGFAPIRKFYEMHLDAEKFDLSTEKKSRFEFHHLRSGEEQKLIDIQDRSFKGTWGYDPDMARHVSWWMSYRRNNHDDIILALDESEVIGYCWTGLSSHADMYTGMAKGRIHMLGVAPDRRRSGAGKKLLVEGIRYLGSKGRYIIELTVDGQNHGAVELYRSNGFRVVDTAIWYERMLSADSGTGGV